MSNNDYGGDTDGNHEFVGDDGDDDHDADDENGCHGGCATS